MVNQNISRISSHSSKFGGVNTNRPQPPSSGTHLNNNNNNNKKKNSSIYGGSVPSSDEEWDQRESVDRRDIEGHPAKRQPTWKFPGPPKTYKLKNGMHADPFYT